MDTGKTDLSPARQKQFEELENEIYELKAELATHRWLYVSEGLPEHMGDYLISNGIWIERVWFDDGYWCKQNKTPFMLAPKITHWKPITLPGKE